MIATCHIVQEILMAQTGPHQQFGDNFMPTAMAPRGGYAPVRCPS
jgi:hypothetical protein